mmetsp:Transcript_13921/g.26095  ORF Transcript_13921/g.26095 Transcript_13921/m.26095 type:complete len:393 (-) Transcript_13921:715-1893(-)
MVIDQEAPNLHASGTGSVKEESQISREVRKTNTLIGCGHQSHKDKMWLNSLRICSPALLLLVGLAYGQTGYTSQKCTDQTSCSNCMNSLNNALLDKSKCIPITPSTDDDQDSGFLAGGATITCASWNTVQSKQYTIDFGCNNGSIPSWEQNQINELRYTVKWAFYAYDAKAGDTQLASMKIFEDSHFDTKVVMGYDAARNWIITSFRGSSNVMNWLSDFNFPKTAYSRPGCNGCSVHTGFLNSYTSLADDVKGYLPTLRSQYPSARIVVTGHSLGGAQAVLGAIDTQLDGNQVYLYTYGSPRVGETNFAGFLNRLVNATNIRAVFINDPVPNAPPTDFNFIHGGTEIHFYGCTSYLADPAFADDSQDINLLASLDHMKYPCMAPGSLEIHYE